jgi:Co/Zn/Cd efflux system component
MRKTGFRIPKMDCSAEERLVRLQLESLPGVHGLRFDLPGRRLDVTHADIRDAVQGKLEALNLGAVEVVQDGEASGPPDLPAPGERAPLLAAFSINATLFLAEAIAGLVAYSMGLLGDSLDMLADAVVYAMALSAVGGTALRKQSIARTTGRFQAVLACAGLAEVLRRFLFGEGLPDAPLMVAFSVLALAGNAATLLLLNRNRDAGVHMKAAWVCTSVDVQVNALVIATGVLVHFVPSRFPDLAVGGLIFVLVANGARRILALAR